MPDWLTIDPQLRQFAAEGVSPTAMATRLNLARQSVVDRLRKLGLKAPKQANAHTAPTAETTIPNTEDQTDVAEALPGQMAFDAVPTEPVSGIPDMVPGGISAPLSSDEAQILEHYEEVIERGIKTFVEVGRALMTIRDRKLGSVADLYFHRELCHAEATTDKEMAHGTRSRDLPLLSQ
jgi:hypothetical protein